MRTWKCTTGRVGSRMGIQAAWGHCGLQPRPHQEADGCPAGAAPEHQADPGAPWGGSPPPSCRWAVRTGSSPPTMSSRFSSGTTEEPSPVVSVRAARACALPVGRQSDLAGTAASKPLAVCTPNPGRPTAHGACWEGGLRFERFREGRVQEVRNRESARCSGKTAGTQKSLEVLREQEGRHWPSAGGGMRVWGLA